MYAEERQQAIAALVIANGRASVTELAQAYDVTTETVRRDLATLDKAGVLRRVHGGAVPVRALHLVEAGVGERGAERVRRHRKDPARRVGIDQLWHPGEHDSGSHARQRVVVEPGQPGTEGEIVVDQLRASLSVVTSLEDEVALIAVDLPSQKIHHVRVGQALLHGGRGQVDPAQARRDLRRLRAWEARELREQQMEAAA